ncbi:MULTISPECIES: hypothetical protein [Rhizobium/Agrobacterium group]|uniref:Uncharacterized protein n=1 Tax=Agrobacterium vitis TaxID=373 RepID=A0ABD6H881_AGRVI|nr:MULTISPECIES: hypothetical protein [Rhizobium/Agrobacterium group]MUO29437.1 hypothetical protein [Agrobacterium vitis]MUO42612.1 hypothetical protein [Agrobacterium vitis]MUP10581.1 hypothetical protein [Agrobacterium vitis]
MTLPDRQQVVSAVNGYLNASSLIGMTVFAAREITTMESCAFREMAIRSLPRILTMIEEQLEEVGEIIMDLEDKLAIEEALKTDAE